MGARLRAIPAFAGTTKKVALRLATPGRTKLWGRVLRGGGARRKGAGSARAMALALRFLLPWLRMSRPWPVTILPSALRQAWGSL
ncbi:hypothetical protein ADT71_11095 [Novosphingobium sp. ST904]|nr:hypothetical protein ADT71_11095 [Novosphingobium sp. ST904]